MVSVSPLAFDKTQRPLTRQWSTLSLDGGSDWPCDSQRRAHADIWWQRHPPAASALCWPCRCVLRRFLFVMWKLPLATMFGGRFPYHHPRPHRHTDHGTSAAKGHNLGLCACAAPILLKDKFTNMIHWPNEEYFDRKHQRIECFEGHVQINSHLDDVMCSPIRRSDQLILTMKSILTRKEVFKTKFSTVTTIKLLAPEYMNQTQGAFKKFCNFATKINTLYHTYCHFYHATLC